MSLIRLWKTQGKAIGSLEILSKIVNQFSEGLDNHDLQLAGEMLETLSI
jgi:hypothetical protein